MSQQVASHLPHVPDVLTQGEAEERAARVRNVEYSVSTEVAAGSSSYRGDASIGFLLLDEGDVFLDFKGRQIERLELDGKSADPDWTGARLILPGLAEGRHSVRIVYKNDFDEVGDGFHRFVDPEDGAEYVYSNFEPFAAHRFFPCFDQPNMKATYRFEVTAPADWTVVSNSPISESRPRDDGRVTRVFAPSGPFSTYLTAVAAGPFHVVRDDTGTVPLGLYARKSLARFLDAEAAELFEITRQGFGFFEDLFGRAYAFGKYDQVFAPEFNPGAMENVGAVLIHESFIFRDPPTENQRLIRGEVVLHEMAHMWFGDLVTMRWWEDLWLNETFATYVSYLALAEATRFKNAWLHFALEKRWAYRQDQLPTTHPISADVPDTDTSQLNFDGITYSKGAAVIKQLTATIGSQAFRDSMRLYVDRHAYGNATLADFLAALEDASGRKLGEWSKLWLETSSVNTIAAEWRADDDRVASLQLTQTAPKAWPVLRPHAVEVALARVDGDGLIVETLPASIDGSVAVVENAAGKPKPSLVFPNYGDLTYAKVKLDAASLAFVRERFSDVTDPLLRQLLWMSLWEMVRDQHMTSLEYLSIARAELPRERNLDILDSALMTVGAALRRFVPEADVDAETHQFVEVAWNALQAAARGDTQTIWARTLIRLAGSPEDVALIQRLADEPNLVPGLEIDQEMRWGIAIQGAVHGVPGAMDRVARERERDASDRGEREMIRAEVSRPDPEAKATAWARIHGDGYGSLHKTRSAMAGFGLPSQRTLLDPYVKAFFENVAKVAESMDPRFVETYVAQLFPSYRAEVDVLAMAEECLAEHGKESTQLRRLLLEATDELERAVACRRYAEEERVKA